MRGILQRVTRASVSVDGEVIGECPGPGALVLVGVTHEDTLEQAKTLARKIAELRIFEDETSIQDRRGSQRPGCFAIYALRRCA